MSADEQHRVIGLGCHCDGVIRHSDVPGKFPLATQVSPSAMIALDGWSVRLLPARTAFPKTATARSLVVCLGFDQQTALYCCLVIHRFGPS